MPHRRDPLRAQRFALLAGCGVAAGILLLDTLVGSARHDEIPVDAALVMSRQSGALFVRVDHQLRPVANLASARLILGSAATPLLVDETAIRRITDGPTLGIPGAPRSLGQVMAPRDMRWAVCDDMTGKTMVAVGDESLPADVGPRTAVVATVAHGDGSVFLLYDGKRALLDPADPVTARVLHLDGRAMRHASVTLLNAIPEMPAISPPRIPGIGQPSGITDFPIGTVLRVVRTDTPEYYVVLRGGLQRIGQLTVDLIRFANPAAEAEIPEVSPELIARSPLVDVLPVGAYPDQPPALVGADDDVCATWVSGRTGVAVGAHLVDRPGSVILAAADGDEPGVDIVRLPLGRSLDVTDAATSARHLISNAGVRFPIDDSAAAALELTDDPAVAPWAVVRALPLGPKLDRDAALVGRDVIVPAS